jgi:hypothetical protein
VAVGEASPRQRLHHAPLLLLQWRRPHALPSNAPRKEMGTAAPSEPEQVVCAVFLATVASERSSTARLQPRRREKRARRSRATDGRRMCELLDGRPTASSSAIGTAYSEGRRDSVRSWERGPHADGVAPPSP